MNSTGKAGSVDLTTAVSFSPVIGQAKIQQREVEPAILLLAHRGKAWQPVG